jgi:PhnB protein
MATKAKAIPEGYHTVTPHLVVRGGTKALEFYNKAFGAETRGVFAGPGGKIMHAEMKIGDSIIMLSDEAPEMGSKGPQSLGGCPGGVFLYVENVDAAFKRATDAGATANMPPQDMFWGDRFSKVTDPFGHLWAMATHIEDVTPEEMKKRGEAFMAQMAQQQKK